LTAQNECSYDAGIGAMDRRFHLLRATNRATTVAVESLSRSIFWRPVRLLFIAQGSRLARVDAGDTDAAAGATERSSEIQRTPQ
jgi:hypothetical protein